MAGEVKTHLYVGDNWWKGGMLCVLDHYKENQNVYQNHNNFVNYSMEKTVKIIGLREQQSDLMFWLSKSPQERLAAIEILRQQYVRLKHIQPGLQRVCRIIKQKGYRYR